MRFHLGAIPDSPDFVPDESWRSLREPSAWMAQLVALPIGIVAALVLAVLWFVMTPLRDIAPLGDKIPTWFLPAFLLCSAGIVVVHELIHAAVHPMAGRSPNSILGFWPSRLLFYAHYHGELTRRRFVAILLMPLAVISVAPLLVAASVGIASGWAAFVSAFNALLACVDMLGAGMLLYQVPATAIVRNQGWKTYWRENEKAPT